MAESQAQNSVQLRKKRKKSRYVKQGYHKSERDDYRRVAARAFLSGITRDSHLCDRPSYRSQAPPSEKSGLSLALTISPARKSSIIVLAIDAPSPPSTPVLEARYSPALKQVDLRSHHDPSHPQQLTSSRSLEQVVQVAESSHLQYRLSGVRTSHSVDYTDSATDHARSSLLHVAAKCPTSAEGAIYEQSLPSTQYYETGRRWRWVELMYSLYSFDCFIQSGWDGSYTKYCVGILHSSL